MDMSKISLTVMLVVGLGITGAVGQDYGSGASRGYPHYNNGYGPQQAQSWPNQNSGWPPNQNNGQRYTTVTVTNRGQNGNRDQVVQQQVACGSQYYDGFRTRTARC
jgi:hypothetical protein